MKELVSIIVPVYNAEKFICETIEAVKKQTFGNWELLLVVDACKDNTEKVIADYLAQFPDERVQVITLAENTGAAGARNKGLEKAKGRYISYLDADDYWVPEKLQKELDFMEENQAAFIFSGYEFANERLERTGKVVRVPKTLNYKQALYNTTIFTSTVVFDTRKIAKKDLEMPHIKSEDTALWWKVLRKGYVAYGLDENLVLYRRPATSLSSNKLEAVRRIWGLYRRAEKLSIPSSLWHFIFWGFNAVGRRL